MRDATVNFHVRRFQDFDGWSRTFAWSHNMWGRHGQAGLATMTRIIARQSMSDRGTCRRPLPLLQPSVRNLPCSSPCAALHVELVRFVLGLGGGERLCGGNGAAVGWGAGVVRSPVGMGIAGRSLIPRWTAVIEHGNDWFTP